MNIIIYLLHCVCSLFSTAFGGNPEGSTIDKVIGLLCVLVFVGLFIGITSLSAYIAKKRKKKKMKGKDEGKKRDFLDN